MKILTVFFLVFIILILLVFLVFLILLVVSFLHEATVRTVKPSVTALDEFVAQEAEGLVEWFEPALFHVRERIRHPTESAARRPAQAFPIIAGHVCNFASQSFEH